MKHISISVKLISSICLCFVITLGISILYSLRTTNTLAREKAEAAIVSLELKQIANVKDKLDNTFADLRNLAYALSLIKDKSTGTDLNREQVMLILQKLMDKNSMTESVFTCWEPGSFDNRDRDFANKEGHDETGRFAPCWTRDEKGQALLQPLLGSPIYKAGEKSGTWYEAARSAKKDLIFGPFIFSAQKRNTRAVILSVPVITEGVFHGIVGASADISFLQRMVEDENRMFLDGSGSLIIFSHQGKIAAHSEDREFVTKPLESLGLENFEDIAAKTESGQEEITLLSGNLIIIMAPFNIGLTKDYWWVMGQFPKKKALADVRSAMFWQAGIGCVALLATIVIISFIVSMFTKPIMHIVTSLNSAANQVAAASDQIASSSYSLASSASEQAISVSVTSAILDELTAVSQETSKLTEGSGQLMRQNIKKSAKTLKALVELTTKMFDIEADSGKISNVVKTIDEVAYQTNLLALNAAVEAARAGEAGAGFAVVADEVRNLAMRAAAAAKDTQELLNTTVQRVSEATVSIKSVNNDFENIVESATIMGDKTTAITNASVKLSNVIQQISSTASEIDQTTQQMAASAEELSSTSGELSGQADAMEEFVHDLVDIL